MTDSGFDAFCGQFLGLMQSVASSDNLRDQVKKRLEKNWTENEIVYFYVMVALYSLSATNYGKRLKVLIQELNNYMSEVVGAAMIKEVVEFSVNVSSDLPIAIGNIKNLKSTSASDIIKVTFYETNA